MKDLYGNFLGQEVKRRSKSSRISRRRVLNTAGAAAVASGASALLGGSTLAAQQGAPAVLTNTHKMIESGQINMKALASRTYPLAQTTAAYREAMNRTVVATIVTPNA